MLAADREPRGVAPAEGRKPVSLAAVVTAFPLATQAGLATLRAGGNAMDAAVAAAWALSVCEPSASGLGGQTSMLVRRTDGSIRIIDGQSRAPAAASLETITAVQQRRGHRACTVPSAPATPDWAQRQYGVLSRAQVLAPAIGNAEDGYPITQLQHRQCRWVAQCLRAGAAAELFLADGRPPPVGSTFRQPALAVTLRELVRRGIEDFYQGSIARRITADMAACGGLITAADLSACAPPVETDPLSVEYAGCRIVSAPAPNGGPQLLMAFNLLKELAEHGFARSESGWRKALALAVSAAFREREHMSSQQPALTLRDPLSRDHARRVAAAIAGSRKLAFTADCAEEPGDTTHLMACDQHGMIVSLTQSIQSVFGAKVAHRTLGFVYNNYLCTCPRTPHAHALAPRCRPRSNIAPTLVLGGPAATPLLALGAAGSRRIISAILQVTCDVIDHGRDIVSAVDAPRVHGLVGGKVWIERPAADDALLSSLLASGREPVIRSRHSYAMAAVHALQFSPDGGVTGAADPRRDGTAGTFQ
ncbi:gamma-glutamyltransferase family protein [Bradyrhizobium stylosanthis]|uniref:Gamma-glutamyltranspeptidase/glutathione hydrolase n=1 Tax=Bradyrhizobium stylosanthis TaxID=1803665 RepID=A0A560D4M1_9BRAD|nr:gamma-glutamyltransferase [Bradyrhizobium stylosanthis]TWA92056.1 gamma-glutamyltranspeptidase/glutathione hydrolase [Bradyrhizobium stylosanthis]